MPDVKQIVKREYSRIASQPVKNCGCACKTKESIAEQIGYTVEQLATVGDANMGLGCGNPTAFSRIRQGDTVVDLGCGGGIDCFLASKKTGPTGRVIGIDFSEDMIAKAKINALKGKFDNVEFIMGDIERLPLEDDSVDIIISNCVINLAPDKDAVFAEAYRVLKPGGRLCVSDIVLLQELAPAQRADEDLIAGCVGGAIMKDEYINRVRQAGFRVTVISENAEISKQQYRGIALESMLLEGIKGVK